MGVESWTEIKEILELAIEKPPGQREQFLEQRCSGDGDLRTRIDSLIDSYERVGNFMEDGAIGSVADAFSSSENELFPGDRLGRYCIIDALGEGGMGKVYLAEDLDLHRRVALKVLRDDLWWYKQARQRLLREARAAARLDHPNICSIYEIGDTDDHSFIAMQYIEGKTLGDVMAHRGLNQGETLALALQIAGALEEAHSHHIIHRDIKPANIIINEKRQAKVLDFGLAKSIEPKPKGTEADISSSGAVMGTVPYMSPEQLRGKAIDARTDIFSFGTLLYEMLTGRQAFGQDNNAETISSILNDEPDLSIIPPRFLPLVKRSIAKNADDRYQTISEMASDLNALADGTFKDASERATISNWFGTRAAISTAFRRYFSSSDRKRPDDSARSYYQWQDADSDARTVSLTEPVPLVQPTAQHALRPRRGSWIYVGAAALMLGSIPLVLWYSRSTGDPHDFDSLRPVRLVSWKDAASFIYMGYSSSHNGKMIAYSSKQEGAVEGIHVRQVVDGGDTLVTKDQWINYNPIWSPDDQQIAFISNRNGLFGIYTASFLGGNSTLVKMFDDGLFSLRHWSNDGAAIYYEEHGNLFRLDLTSRQPAQITAFEPRRAAGRDFAFSSDESRIVYRDTVNGQTDLWVAAANGQTPVRLTDDAEIESSPSWHPDGKRIVYSLVRDGYSQINVAYLDGRPPEQITRGEGEHQLIDVSADGKNLFYTTWEDRSDVWGINVGSGQEFQVAAEKEAEFWPAEAPDGSAILYQTNPAVNPVPFITDSVIAIGRPGEQNQPKRVPGYDPQWLPDSRSISFLRWQGLEKKNALWTYDTVTGEEKLVVAGDIGMPSFSVLPYNRAQTREFSFSPDGKEAAYVSTRAGVMNVQKKLLDSSDPIDISQNTDSSVNYYCPLFSPNGKRVAFISVHTEPSDGRKTTRVWIAEAGSVKEIYVTTNSLRLLGWGGNEDLVLEARDGFIKTDPTDVQLVRLSIQGRLESSADLTGIYAYSAALAADGRSVAFTARQNERDDIFVIAASGGTRKKISSNNDPRMYFGSISWSPDGQTLFFDKHDRVNSISMFENFSGKR